METIIKKDEEFYRINMNMTVTVAKYDIDFIKQVAQRLGKVGAIRVLRFKVPGLSLRESKDIIDVILAE